MSYVLVVLGGVCFEELAVSLGHEDLHWFSGKRTFNDGGVYMRFNGGCRFKDYFFCSCGFAFS